MVFEGLSVELLIFSYVNPFKRYIISRNLKKKKKTWKGSDLWPSG